MRYFLLLITFFTSQITQAQLTANSEWVNGEVLVRFADNISVSIDKVTKKVKNSPIRPAFIGVHVEEVEQLFPVQKAAPDGQLGFYTIGGQWIDYPKLTNIYRFKISDTTGNQIFDFIQQLQSLGTDFVLYAEPNFVSTIHGSYEPNDTLYSQQWNLEAIQADTVQARLLADSTVTDTNTVIAIIDTGVDKDHLDLRNKMWVNQAEINGLPNVDDDQNGYIDDKYGWDFVNNDGNPMDDNNHGTHCAGIAAAETNNNIGIAGVSPGSKIMAVKVMQSGGYGAAADIAQGILYAANNGADIISMSIGGTAPSQVTYDALAVAYAYSFLVASAGNSGLCIGRPSPPDYKCPDGKTPKQNYPAAWSFVLGVESSAPSGAKSGFSNYDEDGPITSYWPNLLNYEVRAPGSQIISTIVAGTSGNNNRYKVQQGTSMACPAVAGGVALLKAFRPTFTHEKVFLYLIKTQTNNIKLNDAIDFVLPPELMYITNEVVDTLGGDEDGRPDAGEIVELVVSIKNTGGYNSSVWAKIELDSLEDPSLVNFINPVRNFGSVSEYAVVQNNLPDSNLIPFKFQLDSNIANSRGVKFIITMWTGDSTFIGSKDFQLTVQNGIEFQAGFYPGKTVLYPNAYYLFSGNTVFDTLLIKPGATLYVETNISIGAYKIISIGTADSLIQIEGVRGTNWKQIRSLVPGQLNASMINDHSILEYTYIRDNREGVRGFYRIENCLFENCYLYNYDWSYGVSPYRTWDSSRVVNNEKIIRYHSPTFTNNSNIFIRNVINNCQLGGITYNTLSDTNIIIQVGSSSYDTTWIINNPNRLMSSNNLISNYSSIYYWAPAPSYYYLYVPRLGEGSHGRLTLLNHLALGTQRSEETGYTGEFMSASGTGLSVPTELFVGGKSSNYLDYAMIDYFDYSDRKYAALNRISGAANSHAHGYVYDIRVNNRSIHWKDNPYNGTGGVGILGNSTHKFEVVFNRPMNTAVQPLLTFGIREPWTQNIVADSASWSADSTVFTAYTTITPLTQSDGINRVSVRLAEDDEHFPCPTENIRFEMRIASTGSLSADFEAIGDTGAINLSWGIPDDAVADFLGTNMYRIDSAHLATPTFVYNKMSIDSSLVDTTVLAGQWYGYYFKIVRTNLSEMNSSDTVWARPWQGRPSVQTLSVTNLTHNSVRLHGRGNPNYLTSQVRFNYGLTSNYSTNTSFQNIGNGSTSVVRFVNLTGLTPGTTYHYRIEGTNSEGTSYGFDSTFTTKAFPTLNFRYDSTLCVNDTLRIINNSTISLGTLNYAWEVRRNGTLVHSSTLPNPKFYLSQSGSYTVQLTVSSDQAVTTSKSGILTVDPIPLPTISASGPVTFCQGSTVTLTAPSGYSYVWNTGETTQSIVVNTSGNYSVTVRNSNGCEGTSPIQVVSVSSLPSAVISTTNSSNAFCQGSNLTLQAPAGMTAYQWKLNGNAITGATSATYSATAGGNYTVLVTNASGCSLLSSAFLVTVEPLPSAVITAASATSFCQGDSVQLSAPSGYSYLWSNGSTTQSITVKNAGSYSVSVVNSAGCTVSSTPTVVTVNYVPTMTVAATGTLNFCSGGSVTLTAAGGFSSYVWSNGATTQNIIVNTAGNYAVTGYTSAGCSSVSTSTSVGVRSLPVSTVTTSGPLSFCQGDSVVLSAPAGYSYVWSTGDTTQSIVARIAGNYAVTVLDSSGCSSTSASSAVVVNVPIRPSVLANSATTFCQGGSVVLSIPSGYSNRLWSTGATGTSITVTQSGTYYVTAQTSNGCVVVSDSMTVTVNALPAAVVTPVGSSTFCAGGSALLNAPLGMSSYQWYKDGTAIAGATDSSLVASVGGNYRVMVGNSSGCSQLSPALLVTVSALPVSTVTASGPLSFCQGDSVVLSAPAGYSYVWSTGDTTQSIVVTQAGSYTVQVINASGCQAMSAPASVSISALPLATITANASTTLCAGEQVILSAPSGMSYAWSTGATTQSISVSQAGSYTVQVTNASGCQATSVATTVTVNSVPVATVTANGPTTFCPGDSVELVVSGVGQIQWNTGDTTTSIWAKASGVYTASVTDSNGCTGVSNGISVAQSPEPAKPTVYYSNNANLLISSSPTGNQWMLNGVDIAGADSSTWYPVQSGLYAVRVTNASGCESTSDVFNYVNIGMEEGDQKLLIYPNPTSGVFTVEVPEGVTQARVYVYDGLGRLVVSAAAKGPKQRIDLSAYARGVYRVTLTWDEGTQTRSLIRN